MRRVTPTLIAICAAGGLLLAYLRTPPNANTGRPGEVTCANCHEGVTAAAESTRLDGLPAAGYRPDSIYRLRLTVRYKGMKAWGFEITCADSANGPAGTFRIIDSIHTQLGLSRGFSYVKQTGRGAHKGKPDSCSWTFSWQAPAAGTGPVTFYWDALPCNNDGGVYGDVDIPGRFTLPEWSPPRKTSRRYLWHYAIPESSSVVVSYRGRIDPPPRIFSAAGRLAGIFTVEETDAGTLLVWPGLDSAGRPVPPGDYFIELKEATDTVLRVRFAPRERKQTEEEQR